MLVFYTKEFKDAIRRLRERNKEPFKNANEIIYNPHVENPKQLVLNVIKKFYDEFPNVARGRTFKLDYSRQETVQFFMPREQSPSRVRTHAVLSKPIKPVGEELTEKEDRKRDKEAEERVKKRFKKLDEDNLQILIKELLGVYKTASGMIAHYDSGDKGSKKIIDAVHDKIREVYYFLVRMKDKRPHIRKIIDDTEAIKNLFLSREMLGGGAPIIQDYMADLEQYISIKNS
jgi:hypothetical protein